MEGARQVGKTWLMKEFGKTQYKTVAYINFDRNIKIKEVFEKDNPNMFKFLSTYKNENSVSPDGKYTA